MRGFKDDFYAWKDSLSKDEQALILKQAQNEFDKKFRKSDEFSQDLPEEKIQSFAKVLKKFFDNEARSACSSIGSCFTERKESLQQNERSPASQEKDDYKKAVPGESRAASLPRLFRNGHRLDFSSSTAAERRRDFSSKSWSQKVPIVRKHVLSVGPSVVAISKLGTCTATASQLQSQDADQRTPDYDALKNKAALVSYSFGLKRRVVEIDRDADRRWMFASMTARAEEAEGKTPSDSAPFEDLYKFSKETAETVHKFLAEANSASSAPAGLKKDIEKVLKENPPSDDFKVRFPRVLHERLAKKMGSLQRDPLLAFLLPA